MTSKLVKTWNKLIKGDPIESIEADELKVTFSKSGIYTTSSPTSPGTSPWSSGPWTTTTASGTGTGWTGTSPFTAFSSGGYGWSELALVNLHGISTAIGHNLRADSNYSELAGIGLVCDTCDINVRGPWANTFGERLQIVGSLMLSMLNRHAYREEWE